MHTWQICHLAMVVPLADTYYMTNQAPDKVGFDKKIMQATAKQIRHNFLTLRRKSISIAPGKLNLLCFVPVNILTFILKYIYKSSFGEMFMYQHAMKAKDKMKGCIMKFITTWEKNEMNYKR